MYRPILLLCSLLLLAFPLTAEQRSFNDKSGVYLNDTLRLDELIVTGTMPKVNLRNLPMSISVISEKQIYERIEPSLLPILTEEVPGLFITQRGVMGYGVAKGSAGGMNIRGVGGSPTAGVLVLIDGHPQYMGLMGHPLADSYQSMMTERVEVVRGPASVLYGSNAMGGVINIITKKQLKDGFQGNAQVMYGSYNTLNMEAAAGWKKDRFNLNGNIGYSRSDGHRQNMDFNQWNGYTKAGYHLSQNWKGSADINLSKTKSSNPGTVTAPLLDNDANITRGMTSIAIENEYSKTSGAIKLYYNFGTHKINDGYAEGAQPLPYRFNSSDRMMGISAYQSYSFFTGNIITGGIDYQHFGGKAKNKFPDETKNTLLADTALYTVAGYINVQQNLFRNKLTLNAGIRLDKHETLGTEWIPQAGVSFTPSIGTVVKAMASKGFRTPTIREMYMFPTQNPNLRPERLMNYELSLLQMLWDHRLELGVNLFYIKGKNMIIDVIVNERPLNINTGKVENKGFELSASFQATRNLRFSTNYSYLDMTHKIVAAPQHKLHANANYSQRRWSLSSGVQYIANMYTILKPEPQKENFVLWNARITFRLIDKLQLFVKGENLLDQHYTINAGYPMPGATLFGGVRIGL